MAPVLFAALVATPTASEIGIHSQRIADSETFFPQGGSFYPLPFRQGARPSRPSSAPSLIGG
jgi:hypothetical protein